jgi:hypothetical protein
MDMWLGVFDVINVYHLSSLQIFVEIN